MGTSLAQLRACEEITLGALTIYLSDPEPGELRTAAVQIATTLAADGEWSAPDTRAWAAALRGRAEKSEPVLASSLGAEIAVATGMDANALAAWIADCAEKSWHGPEAHWLELLSLRSRLRAGEIAGDLARRLASDLPQDGLLDSLAAILAPAKPTRKIVPPYSAQELFARSITPIEYAIQPLASIGNLTLLQGEPKGGKSCFALYLALCAAAGVWPGERFVIAQPRRTLFITYEDGVRRIKERQAQYLSGLGCSEPSPNLFIYAHDNAPRLRLEQPQGRALLRQLIDELKPDLVILDTLSHLHATQEKDQEKMQPVMDALKDLARDAKIAIILIHHTGKPQQGGERSIAYRSRGSSVIAAAADIILDWGDRKGTNITPCALLSKDDDDDKFNVVYTPDDEGAVRWAVENQEDDEEAGANRKRVLQAVSTLAATAPEGSSLRLIISATGLTVNPVRAHLAALHKGGGIQMRVKGQTKLYYPSS